MAKITPAVGSKGVFKVKTPYLVVPNTVYTCVAVRTFVDCYRRGEDVEKDYYNTVGLIDGQDGFSFSAEATAGTSIVTLQAADGKMLYIPDSHIEGLPEAKDLKYHRMVVSVDLGILPSELDLTMFASELKAKAAALTGVLDNEVRFHAYALLEPIVPEEQLLYEQSRLGAITQNKASDVLLVTAQEENERLNENLRLLTERLEGSTP